MIALKSPDEVEAIAAAGRIVAETLELVRERVEPGVSTGELDRIAEEFIEEHEGATPAFRGLYGFPATLCTSVNHEVVHGIPSADRKLEGGDILSVDVGVKLDGYYADSAVTIPVGEVAQEAERLLSVTRRALKSGIEQARPGNRVGDIGAAVQGVVEEVGYSVIRELVGHGVGHSAHEDPQVPNYGERGRGVELREGLVIAIEPMVNVGGREIRTLEDDWTVVTDDGSLSAHYEHTVAVMAEGPRILTSVPARTAAGGDETVG